MAGMQRLLETMRALRAPDGCPWDQAQTHESLRTYLLEEAAEAVDALATGDARAMADELGDVLLQIAFHAVIAEEAGTFTYDDVERSIVEKLIRRHPHVFGSAQVDDAAGVVRAWQAIKAEERAASGAATSAADRVPRSLPALRRAAELGRALAWPADDAVGTRTVADVAADPSARLAALVFLALSAQRAGVDPEIALRDHLEARVREDAG
jgi:MazG family protein